MHTLSGHCMHRVLVLGAGKIGALISGLLGESGAYQVQLADVDESAAAGVALLTVSIEQPEAPLQQQVLDTRKAVSGMQLAQYGCGVVALPVDRAPRLRQ